MFKNQTIKPEEIHEKNRERILQVLEGSPRYRDVTANEGLAFEALPDHDTVIASWESAGQACERAKPMFGQNLLWAEALRGLQKAHPEWDLSSIAVQNQIEDFFIERPKLAQYEMNADIVLRACEAINTATPFPWKEEYAQAARDEQERQALIQRISQGKPTYSCRSNNDGRLTAYESADLHEESLDTLRKIDAIVSEQRRIASMDPAEIKAQRRRDEIARGRQNQNVLPALWTPKFDGNPWVPTTEEPHGGPAIKAGQPIALTSAVIKRLSRDDLVRLIRSFGADAVNAVLGVKPRPEYGRTLIIQK